MQTKIIQIGQRIYTNLYSRGYGTVYAIHGEQRPASIQTMLGGCVVSGGNASFDIVFDCGSRSPKLPESILHGVQWQILWDEPLATPDEILNALDAAKRAETAKELEEIERQMMLERRRIEQQEKYKHLTRATDNGPRGYALGAANIRKELKAAFPGVKFSVKSQSYSGGNSIRVGWQDGPTAKQVEVITAKYQYGSFDGMQDLYESNRNDVFTPIYGGAKYVFEEREYSGEFLEKIAAKVAPQWGQSVPRVVVSQFSGAHIDRTGLKPLNDWDCSSTIDREIMRKAAETDARPKPRYRYNHQTGALSPVSA